MAVIGAGMGGLTASALLARAGLRVCVLDREARPGGYLAGFRRKDFTFDTAIHWLNQCGPGGIVHKVFGFLDPDGPKAPALGRIRRYKGESFDYLLTRNPDELKATLIRDFPEDAAGIERFFASARVLGERMIGLSDFSRARETFRLWDWVRTGLRMTTWGVPFVRYLGDRDCEQLARFFTNPRLRAIFCSESNILSALVPIGWAYMGDFQRPPAGGSQVFAQWLCDLIKGRGSHVVLRADVEGVQLEGGRATGVRLKGGKHVRARWVIAACDIDTLFSRMLPEGAVPAKRIALYRDAELYGSCVTLSIGLDRPPETLGFGEELVFLTRDGVPRSAHHDGDPQTAGLSILAPSLRDPTLAPSGKGTLTIYASAPFAYAETWKTGPGLERGGAYKEFKNAYAQTLLERVETAMAPGLRKHVEVLAVATPVTHLRYTGNRDGSIMGQMPSRKNMRLGVAGHRTPVKNLLVGGHWAQYGGGVPVAVRAAANAALLVLRKESSAAFDELCDVMDGRAAAAAPVAA